MWLKCLPGGGNSKCKGSEAGTRRAGLWWEISEAVRERQGRADHRATGWLRAWTSFRIMGALRD